MVQHLVCVLKAYSPIHSLLWKTWVHLAQPYVQEISISDWENGLISYLLWTNFHALFTFKCSSCSRLPHVFNFVYLNCSRVSCRVHMLYVFRAFWTFCAFGALNMLFWASCDFQPFVLVVFSLKIVMLNFHSNFSKFSLAWSNSW